NKKCTRLADLEMLRLRWRAQLHAVAGARLHQRISERRAPADVAAVEVHLVDADDRDDVFEAGGVLVGHGRAEEDGLVDDPCRGAAGLVTTAVSMRFERERIRESIWPSRRLP